MTGVGGRPEVIIEGSNDIEGPWMVGVLFTLLAPPFHDYPCLYWKLVYYGVSKTLTDAKRKSYAGNRR